MLTKDMLFSGKPEPLGGLSNEHDLTEACPDEFRDCENPWTSYAIMLFFKGSDISNWEWISDDQKERNQQFACLEAILSSLDILQEDKDAVSGWMLSEMLKEVPEGK